MAHLSIRSVRTGDEIDQVKLVDNTLQYSTGAARSIFDGRRNAKPGAAPSDTDLYTALSGWSNGYLQAVAEK